MVVLMVSSAVDGLGSASGVAVAAEVEVDD